MTKILRMWFRVELHQEISSIKELQLKVDDKYFAENSKFCGWNQVIQIHTQLRILF